MVCQSYYNYYYYTIFSREDDNNDDDPLLLLFSPGIEGLKFNETAAGSIIIGWVGVLVVVVEEVVVVVVVLLLALEAKFNRGMMRWCDVDGIINLEEADDDDNDAVAAVEVVVVVPSGIIMFCPGTSCGCVINGGITIRGAVG